MDTCVHLWYYLAEILIERKMFQENVVHKSKTHVLC